MKPPRLQSDTSVSIPEGETHKGIGTERVGVVDGSHKRGMLGGALRARIMDAPEEVRVLSGIPFVREFRADDIVRSDAIIQLDVEGLLVKRAGVREAVYNCAKATRDEHTGSAKARVTTRPIRLEFAFTEASSVSGAAPHP